MSGEAEAAPRAANLPLPSKRRSDTVAIAAYVALVFGASWVARPAIADGHTSILVYGVRALFCGAVSVVVALGLQWARKSWGARVAGNVRRQNLLLIAVSSAVLWVAWFRFPTGVSADLDPSWQEVILDGLVRHRQFGHDLVFTMGPYGFLLGSHATATGFDLKLWSEYFIKLPLIVLAVMAAWPMPVGRRTCFLVSLPMFGLLFRDAMWVILCVVFTLALLADTKSWAKIASFGIALALLGLAKFTLLVLAAAGIAVAAVAALTRRNYRRAGAIAGSWLMGSAIWWAAAGQHWAGLPQFMRSGLEISSGYAWAMAVDGRKAEVIPVLFAVAGALIAIAVFSWRGRRSPHAWLAGIYCFGFLFLEWKHGAIRPDDHAVGLLATLGLFAIVFPAFFYRGRSLGWTEVALMGVSLAGLWVVDPRSMCGASGTLMRETGENAGRIFQRSESWKAWKEWGENEQRLFDLPRIRAHVGRATIDELNYDQGIVMINGLNYWPRPVFQSYTAYTPWLQRLNRDFLLSASAPEFLLVHYTTIDHRYAAEDDALLVAEIPRCYGFVMAEKGMLLLQRRSSAPAEPQPRIPLTDQTVPLGDAVVVPTPLRGGVWMQVDVSASPRGVIRSALYKPAGLWLEVQDAGRKWNRYRLLTKSSREGFLIRPYLATAADFEAFVRGGGNEEVVSVKIVAERGEERDWQRARIRFFELPELRAKGDPRDLRP